MSPNLFVAFYSANGAVRAASSETPDGIFKTVNDFKIEVTEAWEKEGGEIDSLESNGAHVLTTRRIIFSHCGWATIPTTWIDRRAIGMGEGSHR